MSGPLPRRVPGMALSCGRAVIGGREFPIQAVRLRGGKVELEFSIPGPQEPFAGHITIFGEDGQGCWQGKTYVVRCGIPAGSHWRFIYGICITHCESYDEILEL